MTATADAVRDMAAPDLDRAAVMARAGSENFPVASALLPAKLRRHLLAIYGFARLVDEIGDRPDGGGPAERLAALDWAESEIDLALEGRATHPVFVAAGETAQEIGADRTPFVDLIEANRIDQRESRCADYAALERYCTKSANPVGRLVLHVFGNTSSAAIACSDDICTALQLVEHWQDVVEDYRAGRIYLPSEDLVAFGIAESELAGPGTPALRRLMAFEAGRARARLVAGLPLLGMLPRFGRVAIAGFCGGGLAQLDALDHAGYDVFGAPVKASKAAVAKRSAALLARRWS